MNWSGEGEYWEIKPGGKAHQEVIAAVLTVISVVLMFLALFFLVGLGFG